MSASVSGRLRRTGAPTGYLGAVASRFRRHPAAAAALVYAVLSVALYAPALVPGHTLGGSDYLWSAAPWAVDRPPDVRGFGSNYELVDIATMFDVWLEYARERLPGDVLWNPYVASGRPFFGNAQAALLSPFSLPAYFLPFWWSLGVIAVLKAFAAAFGTYLLGRVLGMRFAGALLAGMTFAFSLYLLAWASWPTSGIWVLLPWVLLLTDRVVRDPTPLPAAGLAVAVALQFFVGHPASIFHLLAATVAFLCLRLVVLRRKRALPSLGRPVVAFCLAVAGGAALAAIMLVPLLELLGRSGDVERREAFAQLALPGRYLLGFALYDYWGRATEAAVGAFAQERALYVGALPLFLALAALVIRPTLQRVAVAGFAAVMLAIVLGLPPFPELLQRIPVVKGGNHLRLIFIMVLCLALLAGWGLDDLSRRRIPQREVLLALGVALLVVPVLVVVARGELAPGVLGSALEIFADRSWPSPPPDGDAVDAIRMAALVAWIVFMGLALTLVAARLRGRLAATGFVVLALALVATDLFKAGMGRTPAIETEEATQPSTPGLEYLRSRRPDRFVGLERPLGPAPIPPNVAMRWSLYDARSYDPPVERRYSRLWERAVKAGGPIDTPTTAARLTDRSLRAFDLLSVTDIAQDPAEPRVRDPLLPLAYDERDLRVYANARALPRAGVVEAQRVVPGEDAQLEAVLDPAFDGRRSVVTGAPLPGLGSEPGAGSAGRARITSYETDRVVVAATARRPGELVLTDLHYPGWKVTLDGEDAPLHRVNYLLRGTTLPPGRHRVEFRYEPASWRIGWVVSLFALAGLAAVVVVGLRSRRRVTRAGTR